MSTKEGDDTPQSLGPAIFVGLLWGALMGALWYFRPLEGEDPSQFWLFFGRFHPLIVHVPIGLMVIVPLLELIGGKSGQKAVPAILWLVVLGAVFSTAFGYLLMTGEPDDSLLMERHLWSGLAFGGLAILTLLVRLRSRGFVYAVLLMLSVATVSMAGHLGGALVHGSAYLTKYAPEAMKPLLMLGLEGPKSTETEVAETGGEETLAPGEPEAVPLGDQVVFSQFVLPIMEAKCTECHNDEKTKGKLRLDTHEFIMAGSEGADYPNVEPGDPEASELIYRMTLPSDDDDFMPPDGKDALTPEELEVITWWVTSGASNEATVAQLEADDAMMTKLAALSTELNGDVAGAEAALLAEEAQKSEWEGLSPEEQETRMKEVIAAADHFNFSVMPISAEDDRLKVNVVNASKEFGDEQLATLEPVAERVLWLDLGRSQITDAGMATVAKMQNLERLHLENTKITDAGIGKLTGLSDLYYLNLYGTEVTAAIFEPLAGSRNLRKLYLWQTKVDPAEARAFQRSMSLEVNVGTELVTVDPPKEEPKKEEPKKEEPKKEEPKKEAKGPAKPKADPAKATPKPAPKASPDADADAKPSSKTKEADSKSEQKSPPPSKPATEEKQGQPAPEPASPAPDAAKPAA